MPALFVSRAFVPLVIVALTAAPLAAQDWGARMFDKTEFKFGSVPRLSDTTFKMKVKNPFVEDIQITNLSTSCGCISWVDKAPLTIASGQERELTIRLDTIGHSGDKRVRAYVTLYEPTKGSSSSLTIPVEGKIRSDFEVRPAYVGFGGIDAGKGYIQRIGINYVGGRPDWKIVDARLSNPHLTAKIVEKSRSGGSATYEALVEIDAKAPLGVLRDQLILTTNEAGEAKISIPVDGRIEADIVVTDVQFGSVSPGRTKPMSVVVRGKKPFKIERVDHVVREVRAKPAADGSLPTTDVVTLPADAVTVKAPTTAAAVHVLTVSVTPPTESGLFDEEFSITIEGRPNPVTFKAKGRIVPQEVTEAQKK